MPVKRRATVVKSVLNFIVILPTLFKLIRDVFFLFQRELRIASQSIIKVVVFGIIFFVILISTWLSLLGVLLVFFTSYLQWSLLIAITIIFVINLGLITLIALILMHYINQISFPDTRQVIHQLNPSNNEDS